MILGTAAYMSPEQARGRPADKRADIWSFGVVLYEIVTGERLFRGEDTTDILAAVIKETPDLSRAPAQLRPLLKSCLEKDRKKRLQAIGDWKLLLSGQPSGLPPSKSRNILWPTVAAIAILAAVAVSFLYFREAPAAESVFHLSVQLPDKFRVSYFVLSPDGRTLAITSYGGIKTQIWLRSLDSPELRPLANTDDARNPFWSADSHSLGFFADGKLRTVSASGGPATPLCDADIGGGGAWNRDGVILFATNTGVLQRVSAAGGACTALTPAEPGIRSYQPQFLPDGRHFLSENRGQQGLYLGALDQPAGRKILPDDTSAIFVLRRNSAGQGHLLFQREGKLMAQLFNAETFELTGDPFLVAPQLSRTLSQGQVPASVSANGTLVYVSGSGLDQFQLTWLDRSGKELAKVGALNNQRTVALAPDQKTVALGYQGPGRSGFWLHELIRDVESRFALSPFSGPPVWSPDSSRIAFWGPKGLYRKDAGGGPEEMVLPSDSRLGPSDWSRDGKNLLYTEINLKTRGDIWVLPFDASGKPAPPVPFLKTEFNESQGQFSPDGRWVAYASNESGQNEVYVRPFPSGGGAIKISSNAGQEPRWRRDGEELYYVVLGSPATLMAVPVKSRPGGPLEIGVPKPLFPFQAINVQPEYNQFSYSPAADGQRFLMNVLPDAALPTLNVITNWEHAVAAK